MQLSSNPMPAPRPGSIADGRRHWLRFGELEVHPSIPLVIRRSQPVRLSPVEFRLLRRLMDCNEGVVTREQLAEEVWGGRIGPESRTIDKHVFGLRQKLEENPAHPRSLITIRGRGYCLLDTSARRVA
jgi:DNA-binding response OmpR family regulator